MRLTTPPFAELARETWNGLLDLVYPPKCLVCERLGPEIVCGRCRAGFRGMEPPICPRCGSMTGRLACKDCAQGLPKHVRRARSAGQFEGPLRDAILKLKYGGRLKLADPLAEFLIDYMQERPFGRAKIDLLVPVPLHPSRMREREFNQSALIARKMSAALGIPTSEAAVARVRKTRAQAGLHAKQRIKNMQGAFAVVDPVMLRGQTVLLVDDVITTTSTVDACAEVILAAGAEAVYAVSVARDI